MRHLKRSSSIASWLVLIWASALLMAACGIPRDEKGTLDKVRDGTLIVGIASNKPWAYVEDGEPHGAEYELVQQFADDLNAEIVWIEGGTHELLEALKHYEVDLVIGGLTTEIPALKHVGRTLPYLETYVSVGVAAPEDVFNSMAGREITVEFGPYAAILTDNDAVPLRVKNLSPDQAPLAAPDWQLDAWGLTNTGIELSKSKHVMAVPPGENAWLVRLEKFLVAHKTEVRDMLKEASS